MRLILLYILLPLKSFSQTIDSLPHVPFHDGTIVYEKVYTIDSINDKNKIFNGVKSAIIKNTNYKHSKVDEDRVSGNITTKINFHFSAKPGITRIAFDATSQLSIDVKENRFRVRLYNNLASTTALGMTVTYQMAQTYVNEKQLMEKGKWKKSKSLIIPWDETLSNILLAFEQLVKDGLKDDDF
jgi:hypothetical protein